MARHVAQLQRSSCLLLALLALALLPSGVTAAGMEGRGHRRGLLGRPTTSKSLNVFSLGSAAPAGRTPSPALLTNEGLGPASAPGPAPAAAEAANAAAPAPAAAEAVNAASPALSLEAESVGSAPAPAGLDKEQQMAGEQEVLAAEAAARATLPEVLTPLDPACAAVPHSRYVRVSETLALQAAMDTSLPGDLIELEAGVYDRPPLFNLTMFQKNGLPGLPITVCGSRDAVITGTGNRALRPYIFHIKESSFIHLIGVTLTNGFKGVVLDYSTDCLVRGVRVYDMGYEAIRIRSFSSNNIVQECQITDTGREALGVGEGVYVGSSLHNGVDRCSNNQIIGNTIGPGVTAEMVDVKENTQGGVIANNVFDGSSLSGENYADSWVDVKGSGWLITGNVGWSTLKNGFETHDQDTPRSGEDNVFQGNVCNMGSGPGACVDISCDGDDLGCRNIVRCDNTMIGGTELTNLVTGCV